MNVVIQLGVVRVGQFIISDGLEEHGTVSAVHPASYEERTRVFASFMDERSGRTGWNSNYVIILWGAKMDEIFFKANPDVYRPDFLLCRYRASRIVEEIIPIEVCSSSKSDIDKFYLKVSKVDRAYDTLTSRIVTTDGEYMLCVRGSNYKERYVLLTPNMVDNLKNNGISYPSCMGNKPCYWFRPESVEWRLLFPERYNQPTFWDIPVKTWLSEG